MTSGDPAPDDAAPYGGVIRRSSLGEPGKLAIFVSDEQADEPVDTKRWASLAEQSLAAEGVRGSAELSILFIDETAMTELNERFMGEKKPTDVLAFPIDEEPFEPGRWPDGGTSGPDRNTSVDADMPMLLGDVVICPSVAAANAPTHAGTYDDELALLVVHGILHILGHDHAFPEEAEKMQARERDLLERFHKPAA